MQNANGNGVHRHRAPPPLAPPDHHHPVFIDWYIDKMDSNHQAQSESTRMHRLDHLRSDRQPLDDPVDDEGDYPLADGGYLDIEIPENERIRRIAQHQSASTYSSEPPAPWHFTAAPCTPSSRSPAGSDCHTLVGGLDIHDIMDSDTTASSAIPDWCIGWTERERERTGTNLSASTIATDKARCRKWMDTINGESVSATDCNDPTCSAEIAYNAATGGHFFELEQAAKVQAMRQNVRSLRSQPVCSWMDHLDATAEGRSVFSILEPMFYEEVFEYLDGKSLLCGLMACCKKLYYLRFLDAETKQALWHRLLRRDFPRLFGHGAVLHIPYLDAQREGQLTDTVLRHRVERGLYFSKMALDPFWRTVLNLHNVLRRCHQMTDIEIERVLAQMTWYDVIRGKEDDGGFAAYTRMMALRHHRYIAAFTANQVALPWDEGECHDGTIGRFCTALSKHGRTGWSVLHFDPWTPWTRRVPWKYSEPPRPWITEYGSCFYAVDGEERAERDLPEMVRLIGRVYVQACKGSAVVNGQWVPFLQTFDRSICNHVAAVHRHGWFYRQFMLNEMEDRMRNLRALIDIVR